MKQIKPHVFNYAVFIIGFLIFLPGINHAQSYSAWYNNAQERIDTLRKGDFGIQIIDAEGQPYSGDVTVSMQKHEYPFGIAFDFYEGTVSMGNSYNTSSTVQASTDAEIYKTERWNDYLSYVLPVETGNEYKLTLKFAEIFHDGANARLFDVEVEGDLFLDNYDMYAENGGINIAKDTSITLTATDNFINVELTASRDNAAIKGIVLEEINGTGSLRINCGGQSLTTSDGNEYENEEGYFDPDVNTVATEEQWMKAAMYKYFNSGVTGNSFKWSGIQPQHTEPDYTNFENALRWTQKVGWDLRAHTLLWGGADDHSTPGWVRNLSTPEAITDTCKMRVVREMTRYKGVIKEYDVINEPLTGHADSLRNNVGDSILWNCFKWARSADPDAELYVNDYNVEYNWGQAEEYRDLILQIQEEGGPVTGVGMQAHFWDCCRPNVNELVRNVNIVAEAGLPIKFTEFDYGGNLSQREQAADFIKVLTIAFSHPSMVGMMSWGLSDNGAWRENTGFFDANHKPKLAADTLLYYTQKKWATNFDSTINDDVFVFNAYHGNYEVEVEFDDTTKVFSVPCLQNNTDSIFTLHEKDAVLKGPELVRAEFEENNNAIMLVFNKPIDESSLKRSDFKFFTNDEIGVEKVELDHVDENTVILSLSRSANEDDYASVSYFPGLLKAKDGSVAKAFGPDEVKEPASNVGVKALDNRLAKVYPNPANNEINIQHQSAPFSIEMYNSVGVKVYSEFSATESLKINVQNLNRGVYFMKLSGESDAVSVQKVILK